MSSPINFDGPKQLYIEEKQIREYSYPSMENFNKAGGPTIEWGRLDLEEL